MKKYIAPKIEFVDLRVEERLAHTVCTGACTVDIEYNGKKYYAGTTSA
ncbi:hypothetical protein CLHUN_13680 [Ruminiclostridium hungatei]|uniref:Uncharacterized protein n=1 Tax=Ruminiclostridium hungatei TaxID=48256 RepID=A0A1V4SLX1_RUMHU|nr:hypothetical protein [Ruminiclostridium hungatei]OPX44814.1 hypothetical protein CLHUN_13680 [Ruminiclostridium hungatei]